MAARIRRLTTVADQTYLRPWSRYFETWFLLSQLPSRPVIALDRAAAMAKLCTKSFRAAFTLLMSSGSGSALFDALNRMGFGFAVMPVLRLRIGAKHVIDESANRVGDRTYTPPLVNRSSGRLTFATPRAPQPRRRCGAMHHPRTPARIGCLPRAARSAAN